MLDAQSARSSPKQVGAAIAPRRHSALSRAASLTVAGLLVGGGLGLVGCAGKKAEPDSPYGALESGKPMVISGTPTADTTAFNTANRSLLQAQHGVIDEIGPKPVW